MRLLPSPGQRGPARELEEPPRYYRPQKKQCARDCHGHIHRFLPRPLKSRRRWFEADGEAGPFTVSPKPEEPARGPWMLRRPRNAAVTKCWVLSVVSRGTRLIASIVVIDRNGVANSPAERNTDEHGRRAARRTILPPK